MKTARERALDIGWQLCGKCVSRAVYAVMAADDSESGKSIRAVVDVIEKCIEQDRADLRKAQAPS